jgi:hypothetical protein
MTPSDHRHRTVIFLFLLDLVLSADHRDRYLEQQQTENIEI